MLWFQGSIPAAIASAKRSGAVFVVFLAESEDVLRMISLQMTVFHIYRSANGHYFLLGDDEQSTQMAASWEDEKVNEASSNSFVAIKIDTKSEACLQFSQIYPVVCVPSSFFIGDNGIPLEVIAGSVSADELVTRIHKVQQMHSLKAETLVANGSQLESSVSTPVEPNSTSENSQSRNIELCEAPPTSDTKSDSATVLLHCYTPQMREIIWDLSFSTWLISLSIMSSNSIHVVANGEESSGHATPSQEPSGCSNQRPAEDLTIRVERLTKKLEERREEKRKEEEQREIKKEIERRKTGKEMLDYKRKQEEELTKRMLEERNREKAEDRAARERIKQQIALDRAERAARFAKTKEEVEAAKAAALLAKQAEMEVKRDSSAKERSTIARIQFRLPDGSSFTNQFPSDAPLEEARQFAAQAGRQTTSMVHSSSGDFWTLLGTVLYPFLAIWRLISNFLFSNPPAQTSARAASLEPANLASSSNSEKREPVRKRVLEKRGEDFKKEGKIYRLRTQDDGEDENNTWNGNSTQQM
ncbi:UBX domain-containing protein 4 isoform X4 [Manis javanica]|uniref:UBX domain-containing protein 4 isoform X4 n=1 Tax=Manis javanica TaxID=9974 RepID=UPI003C6D12A9